MCPKGICHKRCTSCDVSIDTILFVHCLKLLMNNKPHVYLLLYFFQYVLLFNYAIVGLKRVCCSRLHERRGFLLTTSRHFERTTTLIIII